MLWAARLYVRQNFPDCPVVMMLTLEGIWGREDTSRKRSSPKLRQVGSVLFVRQGCCGGDPLEFAKSHVL